MSHQIPVFSFAVKENDVRSGMDIDQALGLAPAKEFLWMATSRNWWYQNLIEQLLQVYPRFAKLDYLLQHVKLIAHTQTLETADAIEELLDVVRKDPEHFWRLSGLTNSPSEVPGLIQEAVVSRELDDDSQVAGANFFSFLLSQAAGIKEASQSQRAFLYIQPQPDKSAARL
jgi:hypothetical protein